MTIKIQQAQPGIQDAQRPGFIGGLIEKIRDGRERSRALTLLDSSVRLGSSGGPDFEDSLSIFKGLSPEGRDKVLSGVAAMFANYRSFPFESQSKTASITTLSVFVAEAAALMPKNESCAVKSAVRGQLIGPLKEISKDDSLYDSRDPAHRSAKLAAALALWELGYMDYSYWEGRLSCAATRDFAVTKMLEMPIATSFKEHGWHLLQRNLDTGLAIAIAMSGSQARADFLSSMMVDPDNSVVLSAMEGAIYLQPLPREFLDMAVDAAGRSGELNCKARFFLSAAEALPLLESAGDTQFVAASHLIALYARGMSHIGPLLEGAVFREMKDIFDEPAGGTDAERDDSRAKAADVIFQLHMAGIATPGFTFKEEG